MFDENRFITDIKEKAKLFNFFFSRQCSLIPINSFLTADVILLTRAYLQLPLQPNILKKSFKVFIQAKPIGHDNTNIRMLKICGDSISVLLEMTFKQALLTGVFPSKWKKRNIVPIHKKNGKQNFKDYCPVSLLPICGKIF